MKDLGGHTALQTTRLAGYRHGKSAAIVKQFTILPQTQNVCFRPFCVAEKAISGIARIEYCAYNTDRL
jgi:hypothetical protein